MVFRMSTTPSCRSCWQQMLVAMKQPVLPIPALRAQGTGVRGGAAGKPRPAPVGVWEDPPAVHHDGGAAGPLLLGRLLHLPHQVQEWGRAVWGLLVGPGREPVMLQASLFCPALSRRQRPTPDTRELSPATSPEIEMGREKETQEGGHREWDFGPLPSTPYSPVAAARDPRPGGQWGLVSSVSTGLHMGFAQ